LRGSVRIEKSLFILVAVAARDSASREPFRERWRAHYPLESTKHREEDSMRSATLTLLSLFTLAIGPACSNLKISSDWDTEVDYSKIQSYAWIGLGSAAEAIEGTSSLLDQRVRRAVQETLSSKGFSEVERPQADVFVSYHIGIEKKFVVHTVQRGYGYGYGGHGRHRGYGAGGGYADTRVSQYDEGTFLLDLIDPQRMQLIWRGSAQSRISKKTSPEEREQRVREVVEKVLAQYPPGE
jgi:hypothetical protein